MRGIDIHETDKEFAWSERNLDKSNVLEMNKKHLRRFRDYCLMQGYSKHRIMKYYRMMKHLDRFLGKNFAKATRKDMERVVSQISACQDWAPETKADLKMMIKRFYKWLLCNDEDHPDIVRWIKAKVKRTEKKLPNDGELLSEKDIEKAIKHCMNLRDKALISTLYESGCRVGELCSLRIRDVFFDKHGVVLSVTGKTGPRKVRVVASTPYISNWISNHPTKDERESALWVSLDNRKYGELLNYDAIRMMIHKVFLRAKIKKKHNPHIFRHSRATFLANHLTEFQMNQYFGWVQGSDMPFTYVHLSGKAVDGAILRVAGIEEKEIKKPVSTAVTCKRCDTINPCDSVYCVKCGGAVDAVAAMKIQEEEGAMFDGMNKKLMSKLMQDKPELLSGLLQELTKLAQKG